VAADEGDRGEAEEQRPESRARITDVFGGVIDARVSGEVLGAAHGGDAPLARPQALAVGTGVDVADRRAGGREQGAEGEREALAQRRGVRACDGEDAGGGRLRGSPRVRTTRVMLLATWRWASSGSCG